MSEMIKAALIIAATAVAIAAATIFYSPYHSCMRAISRDYPEIPKAEMQKVCIPRP